MIAIIGGCGANIASVQFALERLGKKSELTTDAAVIQSASHVILPGVGTAKQAMKQLHHLQLVDVIRQLTQPVLGICLGMQILHEYSGEGSVSCLGIVPGKVEIFPESPGMTIPHMGWNQLTINQPQSPLLQNIENESYVYFVHSYAASVTDKTIAMGNYTKPFAAMVHNKNFYGAQFHPERSGRVGAQILQNFLMLE